MLTVLLHTISLSQSSSCGIHNANVVRTITGRDVRHHNFGSVELFVEAHTETLCLHGSNAHQWTVQELTFFPVGVFVESVSTHNASSDTCSGDVNGLHEQCVSSHHEIGPLGLSKCKHSPVFHQFSFVLGYLRNQSTLLRKRKRNASLNSIFQNFVLIVQPFFSCECLFRKGACL